jgi:hypothetical protein
MSFRPLRLTLIVPFAAVTLSAGSAMAAPSVCDAVTGNLVLNCGFETTSDWSPSVQQFVGANSGSYANFSGTQLTAIPKIQQTISTIAGATYELTFYAASGTDLVIDALFDGASVLTTNLSSNSSFQEFVTSVTATTTSTVLEFDAASGYGGLDDVSLVQTSGQTEQVPEPASVAAIGVGLAALTGLRRRRRIEHADLAS